MKNTSLKAIIQSLAKQQLSLMSAKVVSTSKGIKLVATSNEKLIISNDDLIVPSRMKSVKTGDNVYLLFLIEDELFYLLDKV